MQLTFKSTPLSYLQSRLRQVQNQEQTLELRLSEGMPDLGRLLLTGGQARLSSKQWRSDSVSITGGIQAWALYLPEDGSEPMLLVDSFCNRSDIAAECSNLDREGYLALVAKARGTVDYDERTDVITEIQKKLFD